MATLTKSACAVLPEPSFSYAPPGRDSLLAVNITCYYMLLRRMLFKLILPKSCSLRRFLNSLEEPQWLIHKMNVRWWYEVRFKYASDQYYIYKTQIWDSRQEKMSLSNIYEQYRDQPARSHNLLEVFAIHRGFSKTCHAILCFSCL